MKNYECKVILDRTMENGMTKKVTEQYIIQDCLSLSESENRMVQYIAPFASGELEVISSRVAPYHEIVLDRFGIVSNADGEAQKILGMNRNASTEPDRWYRVKITFITLDEKSGKEKRTVQNLLVNACSVNAAHDVTVEHMKGCMSDYEIGNIDETKILDVIPLDGTDTEHKTFQSFKKEVKEFVDSLPKGYKTTLHVNGMEDVVIDKTKEAAQ